MSKTFPFEGLMNHLREIIKEPPYRIFIFISPILLIITFICQKDYIGFFLIILIYSIVGTVWRHAIKDFRGRVKESYESNKFNKINLWLTGLYQLVNIVLVIVLVITMVLFALKKF